MRGLTLSKQIKRCRVNHSVRMCRLMLYESPSNRNRSDSFVDLVGSCSGLKRDFARIVGPRAQEIVRGAVLRS